MALRPIIAPHQEPRWSRIVFLPGVLSFSSELDKVNPGLAGSKFWETTGYSPRLAGSEFGERYVPFYERTGPNPASTGSEKSQLLSPNPGRKDRVEPWFGRFGVRRQDRSNPGSTGSDKGRFGEKTGPNPGSEFGERTVLNPYKIPLTRVFLWTPNLSNLVRPIPFTKPGFGLSLSPNSEPGFGQVLSSNSEPAELRFGSFILQTLNPNSQPRFGYVFSPNPPFS